MVHDLAPRIITGCQAWVRRYASECSHSFVKNRYPLHMDIHGEDLKCRVSGSCADVCCLNEGSGGSGLESSCFEHEDRKFAPRASLLRL